MKSLEEFKLNSGKSVRQPVCQWFEMHAVWAKANWHHTGLDTHAVCTGLLVENTLWCVKSVRFHLNSLKMRRRHKWSTMRFISCLFNRHFNSCEMNSLRFFCGRGRNLQRAEICTAIAIFPLSQSVDREDRDWEKRSSSGRALSSRWQFPLFFPFNFRFIFIFIANHSFITASQVRWCHVTHVMSWSSVCVCLRNNYRNA